MTRLVFATNHSGKQAPRLIQYFGLKIIHNINVKPDVKGIKWEARCNKWNTETQACIDEQMEMSKWHWSRLECWTDIATSAAQDTRTSAAPCFSLPPKGSWAGMCAAWRWTEIVCFHKPRPEGCTHTCQDPISVTFKASTVSLSFINL